MSSISDEIKNQATMPSANIQLDMYLVSQIDKPVSFVMPLGVFPSAASAIKMFESAIAGHPEKDRMFFVTQSGNLRTIAAAIETGDLPAFTARIIAWADCVIDGKKAVGQAQCLVANNTIPTSDEVEVALLKIPQGIFPASAKHRSTLEVMNGLLAEAHEVPPGLAGVLSAVRDRRYAH